jgi:hypothetical protein
MASLASKTRRIAVIPSNRSSRMKYVLALLAVLAFAATPAVAADDKNQESTEQKATEEKDSGVVEKAVKLKAIDKVGGDGIVEKGAKVRVLRK